MSMRALVLVLHDADHDILHRCMVLYTNLMTMSNVLVNNVSHLNVKRKEAEAMSLY